MDKYSLFNAWPLGEITSLLFASNYWHMAPSIIYGLRFNYTRYDRTLSQDNLPKLPKFYRLLLLLLPKSDHYKIKIWDRQTKSEKYRKKCTACHCYRNLKYLWSFNVSRFYQLLKVLGVIPLSTDTAKRSFSTFQRLKT